MTTHKELVRTTNKATGKHRYYVDGVRVSYEVYDYMGIINDRAECMLTTSTKTHVRHYKTVVIYNITL